MCKIDKLSPRLKFKHSVPWFPPDQNLGFIHQLIDWLLELSRDHCICSQYLLKPASNIKELAHKFACSRPVWTGLGLGLSFSEFAQVSEMADVMQRVIRSMQSAASQCGEFAALLDKHLGNISQLEQRNLEMTRQAENDMESTRRHYIDAEKVRQPLPVLQDLKRRLSKGSCVLDGQE